MADPFVACKDLSAGTPVRFAGTGVRRGRDMADEPGAAVTIHVVALRAGVSTATVSRVLQGSAPASDSTRAKVMAAARELGYTPPDRSPPPGICEARGAWAGYTYTLPRYVCQVWKGNESEFGT